MDTHMHLVFKCHTKIKSNVCLTYTIRSQLYNSDLEYRNINILQVNNMIVVTIGR